MEPRVAVLLPCYNEGPAIAGVVAAFRAALPQASVYVYDNNSTDGTAAAAERAGAVVHHERRQGKGNVVRRMFADIDADVYVLADGDGTYAAEDAPRFVAKILDEGMDMATGVRIPGSDQAYRSGHVLGNRVITGAVNLLFGESNRDMLSGYRAFSRRFVKSFPALSRGFEIETELAVHAIEMRAPTAEIETRYGARAEGTTSKLNTWRDGMRIAFVIGILLKDERPLQTFSAIALLLAGLGLLIGLPVVFEFIETGLVPRFPSAILATGLFILSALALACGIIADAVTRAKRETRRLHYLSLPAPRITPSEPR